MKIKFGVVGCGYISSRHAKHIFNHPEAELIGGYDLKPERTREFAETHNVKGYETLEEMLADSEIDIVNICTPNGDHHRSALEVLRAGKHALVEKPMAIRKDYCEEMIKTALDNNCELFVVKQNRFNPPVQAVKKLMQEGKIGEIYSIVVNCFWNRNEAYYNNSDWKGSGDLDGGTLFTQFSHFIDIIYYLFGDMKIVSGLVKNANHDGLIDFEDTGSFIFQLKKGGGIGTFNYTTSCYKQNMEGSITIFAENATIKVGGKYLNTIDYQATNGFDITDLPVSNPANNYGYYQGSMSNHDKIIHNVVSALNGREKIMTNAYEGLKVIEIIENMYNTAVMLKPETV